MWAAQLAVEAGEYVVGVRVDSLETEALLRELLQDRLLSDTDLDMAALPAAFSVRAPVRKIGRRELALLYHGSTIVHKARAVEPVLHALGEMLDGISAAASPLHVRLPLRVMATQSHAVLVAVDYPALVSDPRLARDRIEELCVWRATVDPAGASVVVGSLRLPLAGIVVQSNATLDDIESGLWSMAEGNRSAWAQTLRKLREQSKIVATGADATREKIEILLKD